MDVVANTAQWLSPRRAKHKHVKLLGRAATLPPRAWHAATHTKNLTIGEDSHPPTPSMARRHPNPGRIVFPPPQARPTQPHPPRAHTHTHTYTQIRPSAITPTGFLKLFKTVVFVGSFLGLVWVRFWRLCVGVRIGPGRPCGSKVGSPVPSQGLT